MEYQIYKLWLKREPRATVHSKSGGWELTAPSFLYIFTVLLGILIFGIVGFIMSIVHLHIYGMWFIFSILLILVLGIVGSVYCLPFMIKATARARLYEWGIARGRKNACSMRWHDIRSLEVCNFTLGKLSIFSSIAPESWSLVFEDIHGKKIRIPATANGLGTLRQFLETHANHLLSSVINLCWPTGESMHPEIYLPLLPKIDDGIYLEQTTADRHRVHHPRFRRRRLEVRISFLHGYDMWCDGEVLKSEKFYNTKFTVPDDDDKDANFTLLAIDPFLRDIVVALDHDLIKRKSVNPQGLSYRI